ncbi:MAG: hypothetical protein LBF50_02890 [Azoarcus sp.]|nr:hypothetical protein [Azoarcus sp.]
MNAPRFGDMREQRFDTATLAALARQQSAVPLRRAGALTELAIVGVAACLAGKPDCSTIVLWGSRAGARAAGIRVVRDVVIAREAPFPFDFLATQPILAAIPLQQSFPCIASVLYQPWTGDVELLWQRMRTLAAMFLRAGRHARALCGQVEPGRDEHVGRWQVLEFV